MNDIINQAYTYYQNKSLSDLNKLLYDNLDRLRELQLEEEQLLYEIDDKLEDNIENLYFYLENIDTSNVLQLSLLRLILVHLMMKSSSIVLDAKKEMNLLTNDNYDVYKLKYYVFVASNEELLRLYVIYLFFFIKQAQLAEEQEIVCIDFEYTMQKNELTQFAFEGQYTPNVFIWLVKQEELPKNDWQYVIDELFLNERVTKIIHGSDSKDMPFIQDKLLGNDIPKIIKFIHQTVDTRFPCEYYKIVHGDLANKCSLYDALEYFAVMSKEQRELYDQNHANMGPVADIAWNIHSLGKAQTIYAVGDVLYLKQFYYKMLRLARETKEDQQELYTGLLKELVQFCYLERKGISTLVADCKKEIDPINNYMVRGKNGPATLINIYNQVSIGIIIPKPLYDLDKLLSVNWFKTPLTTIFKKLVYTIISHLYEIKKDKLTSYRDKLSIKFVFDYLDEQKFISIKQLLEQYIAIVTTKIKSYLN